MNPSSAAASTQTPPVVTMPAAVDERTTEPAAGPAVVAAPSANADPSTERSDNTTDSAAPASARQSLRPAVKSTQDEFARRLTAASRLRASRSICAFISSRVAISREREDLRRRRRARISGRPLEPMTDKQSAGTDVRVDALPPIVDETMVDLADEPMGDPIGSIAAVAASAARSLQQLSNDDATFTEEALPVAASISEHIRQASRLIYGVDELRPMQLKLLEKMLAEGKRRALFTDRTGGGISRYETSRKLHERNPPVLLPPTGTHGGRCHEVPGGRSALRFYPGIQPGRDCFEWHKPKAYYQALERYRVYNDVDHHPRFVSPIHGDS